MAIFIVRGPFYVRGTLHKSKWRGAQIEFQQPITLQNRCTFQSDTFQNDAFQLCSTANFQDGAGAASGDATASGALDALADFAGSASGDATASGEGTSNTFSYAHQLADIRPPRRTALGRGAQVEFKQPTPLAILNNQDTAGSASGDAIASGTLDAFADFNGSASGDAITSAEGVSNVFAFPVWDELLQRRGPNRAVKLGRGAQIEFKQPLPIAILNNQDAAGSASGDATASGDLNALGDFAASASGDAIASGSLTALGDFAGSAPGDAIASGSLDAFADQAGSASGDATASAEGASNVFPFSVWEELKERRGPSSAVKLGRGSQVEFALPLVLSVPVISSDGAGIASGDSIASGELDAFADFAGTATGDAIASADGETVIDITGTASGDSACAGFIEDATPPVVVVPPAEGQAAGGAGAVGAWNAWYKQTQRRRKRKKDEPLVVEIAAAAKEEADDRLVALMAEKRTLLAQISELEFARYRAAAQADIKRAEAELALARELEDEDEAIVWLMAA